MIGLFGQAIALFLLAGCNVVSHDIVATTPSPSGKVRAVLEEVNGGATTSFGYEVYLEQLLQGGSLPRVRIVHAYGATRNASAYGMNLKWLDSTTLQVSYLEAKNVELIGATVRFGTELISVHLKAGESDPSAPPGGMLYNKLGRPHG